MQNYNLPSTNHGNTFDGVEFTLPTGDLFNLGGADVKVQVRKLPGDTVLKEFVAPEDIEITAPDKIRLLPHIVSIPVGRYKWDMKITFADLREKTYIGGEWVINAVITV